MDSRQVDERARHAPVLEAYFDRLNQEDYQGVGDLFAPNGELSAPGAGTLHGGSAVAAYLVAALRPYPEHLDQPTRFVYAGATVTVEIRFIGRTADGDPVEFDAVDIFDFDEHGAIARLTSWYDSHAVRQRLREIRGAADGSR
jgi:ketosteroid isomerase-like protein